MDFGVIISLLPYIMQGIDLARSINAQKVGGTKVIDIVQGELPAVLSLFSNIGKSLFPSLPPQSQIAAAAVMLDTATTSKIQSQLNGLGMHPPLVVDGSYGRLTKGAVAAFQMANPPLVADGWAGVETRKVLDAKTVS